MSEIILTKQAAPAAASTGKKTVYLSTAGLLSTIDEVSTVVAYADGSTAQTFTNKTLTAPVLSGTVTGTYTLGGTATISTETVIAPTLVNSWANYGAGYITARYSKDPSGVVTVAFTINSGTAGLMFTLPAGYRPVATQLFPADSAGAIGFVEVTSTGTVTQVVGGNAFFAGAFSFRTT